MAEWYARLGKGLGRVGTGAVVGAGAGTMVAGPVGTLVGGIAGTGVGLVNAFTADGEEEQADAAAAQAQSYQQQLAALAAEYQALTSPYDWNGPQAQSLMRANHDDVSRVAAGARRNAIGELAASGMLGGGYQASALGAVESGRAQALIGGDRAVRQDFFNRDQAWEGDRRTALASIYGGQQQAAENQEQLHFGRAAQSDQAAGQTLTGLASIGSNLGSMVPAFGAPAAGGQPRTAPQGAVPFAYTGAKTYGSLGQLGRAPKQTGTGYVPPAAPLGASFDVDLPGYETAVKRRGRGF